MNQKSMKIPNLNEMYIHKIEQEAHLKKLQNIRLQRKKHLDTHSSRLSNIDQVRNMKSKSFAYSFNKKCNQINSANIQLLVKLEKTKPSLTHVSTVEYERERSLPRRNRKNSESLSAERQNDRISNRLKSLSSSLNQQNFAKDFRKSQQIKSRITKFQSSKDKVELKSERYLLSSHNEEDDKSARKRGIYSSFYKREDILKHRVEKPYINRKNTQLQSLEKQEQQKGPLFPTEVNQKRTRRKLK